MTNASGKPFDETLLTAYLDDELTQEERLVVEQQLSVSESTCQLLEELRSVRTLVQRLHSVQPIRSFENAPWNSKSSGLPTVTVFPTTQITTTHAGYVRWQWQHLATRHKTTS